MRITPFLLAAAALGLMTISANAGAVTFEGYAPAGSLVFVPPAYSESGFTLSYTATDGGANDKAAIFGATTAGGLIGDSTANLVWNGSEGSHVTLTGPGSFDLFSVDLGGYGQAINQQRTNITLTGYLTAGGSETVTFSNLLSVTTENIGWTGLDHVDFFGSNYGGMDNLVVRAAASATPEPGTMLLLGAGAAALALVRRRKSLRN